MDTALTQVHQIQNEESMLLSLNIKQVYLAL